MASSVLLFSQASSGGTRSEQPIAVCQNKLLKHLSLFIHACVNPRLGEIRTGDMSIDRRLWLEENIEIGLQKEENNTLNIDINMQDATFESNDELPCQRIFLFGLHISVDRQHNLHRVWDGKIQIGFSSMIGTYRNILLVRLLEYKSILIAPLIRIPSSDPIELYHGDVDPLTGGSFYDPRLRLPPTAEWRWGISEDVLRSRGGWEQTRAIVVSNYKTNLPSSILEDTEKTTNRKCSLKRNCYFIKAYLAYRNVKECSPNI